MKTLLRLDSSTRGEASHSKNLAKKYADMWLSVNSEREIIYRDLYETNVPHLTQKFIEAMYTPAVNRDDNMRNTLILSDLLIAELKEADIILLSVPMYNFSVPSSLKAYIDHISRIGETFSMDDNGFSGLITEKKLVIIASYGALFDEMKQMDFVEPYLKSFFGFLGFTEIEYFSIEGTSILQENVLIAKEEVLLQRFNIS